MLFHRLNRIALIRGLAIKAGSKGVKKPEPKFTQSAAFQGRNAPNFGNLPGYKIDPYSTDANDSKKIFSALGSLLALIIYFGWLREPSDLDEIWSTPPHVLTSNLERRMLREQIKDAEAKHMDTTLLKAQLDYVDVKEAALRIQFEQKTRLEERRKQKPSE